MSAGSRRDSGEMPRHPTRPERAQSRQPHCGCAIFNVSACFFGLVIASALGANASEHSHDALECLCKVALAGKIDLDPNCSNAGSLSPNYPTGEEGRCSPF